MALKMESSTGDGREIQDAYAKPCPFCGGTNLEITNEETYNKLCRENGSSMMEIKCKVCRMGLPMYNIPGNRYWMGAGMLLSKWNTRNGGEKDAD